MKDHQEEFDKGRIVERYVSVHGLKEIDTATITNIPGMSREQDAIFTDKILIVLPPKPLEITGYWCDRMPMEEAAVCVREQCGPITLKEWNCRPVTFVEKGACQCK